MAIRFRWSVAIGCLSTALGWVTAAAQAVRLVRPDVSLDREFSDIRGVRELPDGRILVSDYRDQRVLIVDFDRRTATVRVSEGSGPLEARLPTALVPALGDSTILVDLGNQRLAMLDAEGRVGRTIAGDRPGLMGLRGVTPRGEYLFAIPGWAERDQALPDDSVRIVRWHPGTGAQQVVAVIQGERMRSDIRRPSLVPRIPVVGYGSRDGWLVDANGALRIVRGRGFQVETHRGGATPIVGPSYRYETTVVSKADRTAFVRDFLTRSPMSGRGEGGGMGFSPPVSDEQVIQAVGGTEFAERHPMFEAGRLVVDPGGRLWVGRPARPGQPTRYDLFDQGGRMVATVELLPGRRVAAVGKRGVYLVAEGEDGVQFVERHPLPK
ncbi:MAG: hypothetical protein ACKVZ0_14270 [Gemmatimonadales bacterium]